MHMFLLFKAPLSLILKVKYHYSCSYNPMASGTYLTLPKEIKTKKSLLNIQNLNDSKCLAYCLAAAELQRRDVKLPDPQRSSSYDLSGLNMEGISYPTQLSQVKM